MCYKLHTPFTEVERLTECNTSQKTSCIMRRVYGVKDSGKNWFQLIHILMVDGTAVRKRPKQSSDRQADLRMEASFVPVGMLKCGSPSRFFRRLGRMRWGLLPSIEAMLMLPDVSWSSALPWSAQNINLQWAIRFMHHLVLLYWTHRTGK